jgi:hypothetical protein
MTSTTATAAEQVSLAATTDPVPEGKSRRTRRYRKRTKFQHVPKMAYPVRSLWDAATPEEREQAHHQCTALLELWLGKATKEEVQERLKLAPLRLWQLSQQALSGMVAGLLRQPKRRVPKGEVLMPNPESDVKMLRRRNAELEKENQALKSVLALLRELPGNRERAAVREVRRREDRTESPVKTATPMSDPAPSEPRPAASKTATKTPRGRPKADRGSAPESTSTSP